MKFSPLVILCAAVLLFSSCDHLIKGETKSNAPVPKKVIDLPLASFAMKIDPSCQMPLKKGEISDTATYQGKLYGFCGAGCKEEFLKNPGQYLNQ